MQGKNTICLRMSWTKSTLKAHLQKEIHKNRQPSRFFSPTFFFSAFGGFTAGVKSVNKEPLKVFSSGRGYEIMVGFKAATCWFSPKPL